MSTTTPETTPALVDSLQAFESVRAEIDAVDASELTQINIDILIAVTTVLGILPKLRQLRPLLAKLPGFDIERFDRLERIARALGHAHAMHLGTGPSPEIAETAAEAVELRETLLADATAAARRGFIDPDALKNLKGPIGYRNLAFDLAALANLLLEAWPLVEGKSAVQMSELHRARTLADRLLTAVGLRQFDAPGQTDTALTRNRAFALFIKNYDQVRRAVSYLRWNEGDADEFAPSLYERRHVKSKANEAVPAAPPPAAPAAPAAPVARSASVNMPGLPGDDPFEAR